jgi:hypothetical protein
MGRMLKANKYEQVNLNTYYTYIKHILRIYVPLPQTVSETENSCRSVLSDRELVEVTRLRDMNDTGN